MQSKPTISWRSRVSEYPDIKVSSQHCQIRRTQRPVKTKRRNREQIRKTFYLYVLVLQSIDNKWENRKVRPLCLTKHYATKANTRVWYRTTNNLTLALDGGEVSFSPRPSSCSMGNAGNSCDGKTTAAWSSPQSSAGFKEQGSYSTIPHTP